MGRDHTRGLAWVFQFWPGITSAWAPRPWSDRQGVKRNPRILADLKKMDGKVNVGLIGDSLHLARKGYDIRAKASQGKVKELPGATQ